MVLASGRKLFGEICSDAVHSYGFWRAIIWSRSQFADVSEHVVNALHRAKVLGFNSQTVSDFEQAKRSVLYCVHKQLVVVFLWISGLNSVV